MGSSSELVELFREVIPPDSRVEVKKMFGWPCGFVNGKLFFGLFKQMMLFRLPEDEQLEFLKMKGAARFEPMPGRKSKNFVVLAEPQEADRALLDRWIERALVFGESLPAKRAKKTAKKKR